MSSSTGLALEPGGPCACGGAVLCMGDVLTPEFVLLVPLWKGQIAVWSDLRAGLIILQSSSIWKVEGRAAVCFALGTDIH